jgi:septal ring factor EnvC (AmiA/AmiB activator)
VGWVTCIFVFVLALFFFLAGCAKKPNIQEMQQLEEQRRTIDEQEKKLKELQAEREKFEALLETKKGELKKLETERDSLKTRLGK